MEKNILYKRFLFLSLFISLIGISCYFIYISLKPKALEYSGYIEPYLSYISSSVQGKLITLPLKAGNIVKKDQLLFAIDPTPFQYQLALKRAEADSIKAKFSYWEKQYKRTLNLYKYQYLSSEYKDKVNMQFKIAQVNLMHAKNTVALAQWYLNETQIKNPYPIARIYDIYYHIGEQIVAKKPVVALLVPDQVRLVFYIPAKDLIRIKNKKDIYFIIDQDSSLHSAHISHIALQPEYTPPVLYTDSSRSDLVYKIEAHITDHTIIAGQPVSVILSR